MFKMTEHDLWTKRHVLVSGPFLGPWPSLGFIWEAGILVRRTIIASENAFTQAPARPLHPLARRETRQRLRSAVDFEQFPVHLNLAFILDFGDFELLKPRRSTELSLVLHFPE
jgi:hypothetical protein